VAATTDLRLRHYYFQDGRRAFFVADSVERDANPPFLAPDDMTRPVQIVGLNDQFEPVGDMDIERAYHLERGAGVRRRN
jgi:hypothetical protein